MSLLKRAFSVGGNSDNKIDGDTGFMFTGNKSGAGEIVTPHSSNKLAPYYACVRNISEDMGKMPFKVYKNAGNGAEVDRTNKINKILNIAPNNEMGAMTFRSVVTAHALETGNGYAEIERNGRGECVGLYPIHPSRVVVERDSQGAVQYKVFQNAEFLHIFKRQVGSYVTIPREDMIHIKGHGADGLVGYSVLNFAIESIGTALATQNFGASLFGNGAIVSGFFEHPNNMSKEAQGRFLESFESRHRGSKNAHKTMILEEGMKWETAGMPPKEAQFMELRQFQTIEICRWFRMPPHKIQDLTKSSFSSLEQQNTDYVIDTLTPWAIRWEQECNAKLLNGEQSVFTKFSFNSLLRGDTASRGEFYTKLFNMGSISPNEIRDFEEMQSLGEFGDNTFIQLNLQKLKNAGQQNEQEAKEEQGKNNTPKTKGISGDNQKKASEIFKPIVQSSIDLIARKEDKAVKNAFAKYGRCDELLEWADVFYASQVEYAKSNLSPVALAVGNAIGLSTENTFQLGLAFASSMRDVFSQRLIDINNGVLGTKRSEMVNVIMGEILKVEGENE